MSTPSPTPTRGTPVVFRASAVTPLDPKACWRGIVMDDPVVGYADVEWTLPGGRKVTQPERIDLLAQPGSLAANERNYTGPAFWGTA